MNLKSVYKDLDIKCENLIKKHKTNSFLLNAFNSYKSNLKTMYNIYMNDPHYKDFINVLNTSLKRKRNDPKSNYRFLQNKKPTDIIDFNVVFDEKERKKLSQNFVNTISSKNFTDELRSEYNEYKKQNLGKLNDEVSKFYIQEQKDFEKEKEARETSERLVKSVNNFVQKHRDEYKQEGILTIEGKIEKNPHDYIIKEGKMLKEKFKEDNYTLEDIDKLMKLDKILGK